MIKKLHEITIEDYNIIEQTGKFNHLVKWIPVFLCAKKIRKILDEIGKILNDKESEGTEEIQWQIQTIAKIQAIEINYLGVINLLELGTRINAYKPLLVRQNRRKIKITNDNLKLYIDNIYNFTGINIKTLSDVEKVRKELTFRKDKYNETYNVAKKPKEKVYLMSVVLGVFSYLNQPINVNMTIVNFNVLRKEAVKRMQKEQTK